MKEMKAQLVECRMKHDHSSSENELSVETEMDEIDHSSNEKTESGRKRSFGLYGDSSSVCGGPARVTGVSVLERR